jgi:hypothetical protein
MAVRFNLYYFSQETGEYLQEVVNTTPQGIVAHVSLLSNALPELFHNDAEVYFIEYDDRIAKLDLWIENIQHQNGRSFFCISGTQHRQPVESLALGAQECFVSQSMRRISTRPATPAENQNTLHR